MTDKKEKEQTAKIPSDGLFKSIMEDEVAAREFFEYYLPVDFKELINFSKITLEKESYIEDNLKRALSDVVSSVKTKVNKKAFVYILIEQ